MDNNNIPRRAYLTLRVPAEVAIDKAIEEIEKLGTDPLLTDIVFMLSQAKDNVSDYVENVYLNKQ